MPIFTGMAVSYAEPRTADDLVVTMGVHDLQHGLARAWRELARVSWLS